MAKSSSSASSSSSPALHLLGSHKGRPAIPLTRPANVIGSRQDISRIHLDSSTVSKAHAVIVLQDTGCYISDLGSRMGVYVNREKVIEAFLHDGDEIQIGRFAFKYSAGGLSGVDQRAPKALLDISTLTDEVPFEKRVYTIGQRKGSDIEIASKEVSNIHAIIYERNGSRHVRDMGSRTGTWIDDAAIHQEEFPDNTTIRIGGVKITCLHDLAASKPAPAVIISPHPVLPVEKVVEPEPEINLAEDLDDEPDLLIEAPEEPLTLELDKPIPLPRSEVPIVPTPTKPAGDDRIQLDLEPLELVEDEKETVAPVSEIPPFPTPIVEPVAEVPAPAESDTKDIGKNVADEEDALQLLRRGWHGSSQVIEPELPVEPIADVPTPFVEQPETSTPVTESPLTVIEVTQAKDAAGEQALEIDEIADESSTPLDLDLEDEDQDIAEAASEPAHQEILDLTTPSEPAPIAGEDAHGSTTETVVSDEVFDPVAEPPMVVDAAIDEPVAEEEPVHVLGTVSITQLDPAIADEPLDITSVEESTESSPAEPFAGEMVDLSVDKDTSIIADEVPPAQVVPPTVEIDLSSANFEESDDTISHDADDMHFVGLSPSDTAAPIVEDPIHDDEHADDLPIAPLINLADDDEDLVPQATRPETSDTLTLHPDPVSEDVVKSITQPETLDPDIEKQVTQVLQESIPLSLTQADEVSTDDLLDFLPKTDTQEPSLRDLMPPTEQVMGGSLGFVNTGNGMVMGGGSFAEPIDDLDTTFSTATDTGSRTPLGGETTITPPAPNALTSTPEPEIPEFVSTGNAAMLSGFAGGHERVPETPVTPPAIETERPHRVGFNGADTAPTTSPFASGQSNTATIADLLIGMRAKSSVDVFSSPSPVEEIATDYLGGGLSTPITRETLESIVSSPPPETEEQRKQREEEMAEISITAMKYRPRGQMRPVSQEETDQFRPGGDFASAIASTLEKASADRRKHMRMAIVLSLLILPLSALAFMVGYQMTEWRATLSATLTFDGMSQLSPEQLRNFRFGQNELLLQQDTRQRAIEKLNSRVDADFLRSMQATRAVLNNDASVRWPDQSGNLMSLVMTTTKRDADEQRLRALAEALLEANSDSITRRNELEQRIRKSQNQVDSNKDRIESYQADITKLKTIGSKPMPQEQMQSYERAVNEANKSLIEAKSRETSIEASLLILASQTPTTRPVGMDVPAEIAKLDKEIEELSTTLDQSRKDAQTLREQTVSKSEDARKMLDNAIVDFQKQLEQSKMVATDNPELKAYIESATVLFQQTKDLTDKLLHRQEQQYTRLKELKDKFASMNDARIKEVRDTDPKLKEYTDNLAILTRQFNAAVAEGMTKDADSIKTQMALLTELQKERESSLVNDPAWVESMTSLQKVIDQTSGDINADRLHVNETLVEIEKKFSASTPAVANLPEDQKLLTQAINSKIAAIAKARQDFNALNEVSLQEQAKRDQEIKDKLGALESQLALRKTQRNSLLASEQELQADADRLKKLAEGRRQLEDARVATDKIQRAYDAAVDMLRQAKLAQTAFMDSAQKVAALEADRDQLVEDNKRLSYTMSEQQKQINAIVVPGPTVSTQAIEPPDRRPMVGAAAAGGVFLLMLVPIVANMVRVGREKPPVAQPTASSLDLNAAGDLLNVGSGLENAISTNGHVNGSADKQVPDSKSRL